MTSQRMNQAELQAVYQATVGFSPRVRASVYKALEHGLESLTIPELFGIGRELQLFVSSRMTKTQLITQIYPVLKQMWAQAGIYI